MSLHVYGGTYVRLTGSHRIQINDRYFILPLPIERGMKSYKYGDKLKVEYDTETTKVKSLSLMESEQSKTFESREEYQNRVVYMVREPIQLGKRQETVTAAQAETSIRSSASPLKGLASAQKARRKSFKKQVEEEYLRTTGRSDST
jgi:hypothetical protein